MATKSKFLRKVRQLLPEDTGDKTGGFGVAAVLPIQYEINAHYNTEGKFEKVYIEFEFVTKNISETLFIDHFKDIRAISPEEIASRVFDKLSDFATDIDINALSSSIKTIWEQHINTIPFEDPSHIPFDDVVEPDLGGVS